MWPWATFHPPVVYPGSIERIDFGEAGDDKFFVVAEVEKGHTRLEWRKLTGIRPFLDCFVELKAPEDVDSVLRAALPPPGKIANAIVRLTVQYPREWESLIDEASLRRYAEAAFEFHLIKRPQAESRIRLPAGQTASSLSPLELLKQYWQASHTEDAEMLQKIAREIIEGE